MRKPPRFPLLRMHLFITAAAGTAMAGAVAYASWTDQLDALLWCSLALFTLIGGFAVHTVFKNEPRVSRPSKGFQAGLAYDAFMAILAAAALLSAVGILLIDVVQGGLILAETARQWMGRGTTAKTLIVAGTAVATAVVGSLFFVFRLRQRLLYGATEALAGMAVAGHRISSEPGTGLPSETGFYFAVLTAGVYLVVRGLDNMHQATLGKDPIFEWLRSRGERAQAEAEAAARANSGANPVRNERQ